MENFIVEAELRHNCLNVWLTNVAGFFKIISMLSQFKSYGFIVLFFLVLRDMSTHSSLTDSMFHLEIDGADTKAKYWANLDITAVISGDFLTLSRIALHNSSGVPPSQRALFTITLTDTTINNSF